MLRQHRLVDSENYMSFVNTTRTVKYHHPSWPEDSFIRFQREISRPELMEIGNAAFERLADGRSIVKEDIVLETIYAKGTGWEGSEFILPADFTCDPDTDEGKMSLKAGRTIEVDGEVLPLHPLAGQALPFEHEWIKSLVPWELEAIGEYLNDLYKMPTEDELDSFRKRYRGADRSSDSKHKPSARKESPA